MSQLKEEILKLADNSVLTNKEIAKVVGCSPRTVTKYAGNYVERTQSKEMEDSSLWEIQKTVLLPDIHYPHYEERVMDAVGEFILDYEPDEIVYMGDQLSLDCISGWNKNRPLLKEGQRLLKDYNNFDRDVLQVHEGLTKPETRRTFMIGNHEQRIEWYTQIHPELAEFIDIGRHLDLLERGYNIIPFNLNIC